ncbi:uncharacterized protein LOC135234876 isoform X1 [Anguilla rostrata]|uniref:uncharacterized protein LOC135234876 isoform X1 n=1 Tax=Anguilla rostrata TaxID=7938 RepID=UPI0030D4EF45
MELCQMAIKIEGDEPEKRAGVNVKEEEQESEINRRRPLILGRCQVSFDGGRRPSVFFDGDPARACDRLMAALRDARSSARSAGTASSRLTPCSTISAATSASLPTPVEIAPRTCRTLAQLLAHRHTHLPVGHPLPAPPATAAAEGPRPPCERGRVWYCVSFSYPSVSSLQCPRCFITFRDLQTSLQHMRLQHPALYDGEMPSSPCSVRGVSSPSGTCRPACSTCACSTPLSTSAGCGAAPSSPAAAANAPSPPPASSPPTSEPTARAGKQAGRRGRGKRKNAKMPTSPSLLPLPDRHKCPHCNFLFRDAKTKMRHMNVKDPTGCPLPPPLFFSTGDEEREEEEEVVMAVQVKEEDEGEHEEDDFSTALRHRGNLNPASPHQGEGKEGVVRVPIKPDAGDVRTKEETIEGVCECALCGKGFEQLLAAARQKAPWPAQGPLRPPGGPGPRLRALRAAVSQPGGAAAAPEAAHAGAALPLPGKGVAALQGKAVAALQGKMWLLCRERCGCSAGELAALLGKMWLLCSMGAVWACHVLFGGEDCGNTFKRASGLQRHRSIHTQVLYSATASTQPAPELQDRLPPPVPQIH